MVIAIAKLVLKIIKNPFILFGIYAAIIPFDQILGIGTFGTITKYVILALMYIIVMNIISFKRGIIIKVPNVCFYFMSFIVWAFLSIWWSFDRGVSISGFISIFGLYIFYLIIAICPINIKNLNLIKTMIIIGGVVSSLITLYLHYNVGTDIFERATIIIGNRYIDPNHLSVFLIIPFFLLIEKYYLQTRKKIFLNIFFLVMMLLISTTLVLAASRTAIIALIFAFIFLLFRLPKKYHRKRIFLIIIIGIVLIFIVTFNISRSRLQKDSIIEQINRGRLSIIKVGIKSFYEKPIFGWGYSNFQNAHYDITSRFQNIGSGRVGYTYPHNIYLRILVELGIIGIIIFLLSLYKHWHLLRSLENNSKISILILEAIFIGMLISGLFLGIFYRKYFWLVLSLIMMERNIIYKKCNLVQSNRTRK